MDAIDLAQQRQQEDIDHALAARKAVMPGLGECLECGESITALRQELGARLCIECQRHSELQARQWKARG